MMAQTKAKGLGFVNQVPVKTHLLYQVLPLINQFP